MITSLDPVRIFAGKHEPLVINAHGCGVIVREQLEKGMPMTVELVSNGRIKKARVVIVRPLMEGVSWLLGLAEGKTSPIVVKSMRSDAQPFQLQPPQSSHSFLQGS